LAPLHASILLTSCNDHVIRLFYLPTADIALLNSALALIRIQSARACTRVLRPSIVSTA
jgi:hypothetical protein